MGLFQKKSDTPKRRQADLKNNTLRQVSPSVQNDMFRRNRTLTGSTSNQLSNSHHDTNLQSPRTHAHNLALRRRKVGGILTVVVIGGAVLYWLISQFTAQVNIVVSDTTISHSIKAASYASVISKYLDLNPIARLRFSLDEQGLTSYLTHAMPEVASVAQAGGTLPGMTNFTLTMRRPVAGWSLSGKQYFVDASGVAFEQNYFSTPDVQIIDNSGASVQQGSAVASNRFLSFVGRIVSLSQGYGYKVTQAVLPLGTTRELEVTISNVTSKVRLSIDRPAGEQAEDMSKALKYLAAKGDNPAYIDVRVSGKAFYQ